jgi:hypothetical protein
MSEMPISGRVVQLPDERVITREVDVPAVPETEVPRLDVLVVITCEVDVPCTVVPQVFVPGAVTPTVLVPGELMRMTGGATRTTLTAVTPRGTKALAEVTADAMPAGAPRSRPPATRATPAAVVVRCRPGVRCRAMMRSFVHH